MLIFYYFICFLENFYIPLQSYIPMTNYDM